MPVMGESTANPNDSKMVIYSHNNYYVVIALIYTLYIIDKNIFTITWIILCKSVCRFR